MVLQASEAESGKNNLLDKIVILYENQETPEVLYSTTLNKQR